VNAADSCDLGQWYLGHAQGYLGHAQAWLDGLGLLNYAREHGASESEIAALADDVTEHRFRLVQSAVSRTVLLDPALEPAHSLLPTVGVGDRSSAENR
jgi:hypothetical protein